MAASETNLNRNRAMARLYHDDGMSYAEIGRAHGLTRERVRQIITAERKLPYLQALDVERERIAALAEPLLAQGLTRRLIAKRLGIKTSVINYVLVVARHAIHNGYARVWQRRLLKARQAGGRSRFISREWLHVQVVPAVVTAIKTSGMSLRAIAQKSGVSYLTVLSLSKGANHLPRLHTVRRLSLVFPTLATLLVKAPDASIAPLTRSRHYHYG